MANPSLDMLCAAAKECHELLAEANIPHVLIGSLVVRLYGYERPMRDVDFLVRADDWQQLCQLLTSKEFRKKSRTELVSPSGVKISFRRWREVRDQSEAWLPDPTDSTFQCTDHAELAGVPVFGDLLAVLQHKFECAVLGQRRGGKWALRARKHFKDVVGLLEANGLLP